MYLVGEVQGSPDGDGDRFVWLEKHPDYPVAVEGNRVPGFEKNRKE